MSMHLTQQAQQALQKYRTQLAKAYSIQPAALGTQFSVTGPVETKLRQALLESVEFLKLINCLDVDQVRGQVVQVGAGGLYTGRVDGGRFSASVGVNGNGYELVDTDSCAQLDWATLCTWANSGNDQEFIRMVTDFANRTFALDMLRIGFNGESIATTTDPDTYPLGQDVNKGWHQLAREWNGGSQIVKPGVGDKIYFDPDGNGDYVTLDHMAADLINTTIDPAFRTDPRLVVLVGADLVAAAQSKLYSEAKTPTEQIAAQQLEKSIAGRKAYIPPCFPANRMVVTILENLHIYTQRGTRKREVKDHQDTKTFNNRYWRMEGYALPEYKAYAGFEEADVVIGPRPITE